VTVSDAGETKTEKSEGNTSIVYVALATPLLLYPLASAIASSVSVEETTIGPL
jgi:hypothetical protein